MSSGNGTQVSKCFTNGAVFPALLVLPWNTVLLETYPKCVYELAPVPVVYIEPGERVEDRVGQTRLPKVFSKLPSTSSHIPETCESLMHKQHYTL